MAKHPKPTDVVGLRWYASKQAAVEKVGMGFCPICKTSANLEQPTGGDYRRVECRKCGKFQITGSALAILPSRFSSEDKKMVARLSHAIRLMSTTTDAQWPEINSVNLDDMLKQPLPSIDRQMTNLLVWAAAQLGDDQLGTVELPDEEDLTAVIGTVDGNRVDDLISRTKSDGLIEFIPDHCIGITAKGWARLQPPPKEKVVVIPSTSDTTPRIDRIIKAHCNKCRGTTNSWVRAEHTVNGSDGPISWSNSYEVLQCCGCDTLSVRHEYWFSEWDEVDHDEYGKLVMRPSIKETYYPAPTVRTKPTWSDNIGDEVLRDVLDELYSALTVGLNVLASVGARTLLDRAGYLLIGDPKGGFEGKLSALVTGDFISSQEKETLDAVADAGNASAHRGYTPKSERLGHIVDIIENFLHRAFVLTPAAEDIRKSTPPRRKGP
jgi:hypothetical protein